MANRFKLITSNGGLIKPLVDTLTGLQVQDTDGNTVFDVDTINNRVGIGVATPTYDLSFGNDAAKTIWIENSAETTVGRALTVNAGSTIAGATTNVAGGNLILNSGLGKGTGDSSIIFQTGKTLTTGSTLQTLTTAMTILGSGNVGIGTVSPAGKLHIKGSADVRQLIVEGNGTQTANLQEWGYGTGYPITSIGPYGSISMDTYGSYTPLPYVGMRVRWRTNGTYIYGATINAESDTSTPNQSIYGIQAQASTYGVTVPIASMYGLDMIVNNAYGATVSYGYACSATVYNPGGGEIENAYSFISYVGSNTGKIDAYYGLHVGNNANSNVVVGSMDYVFGIYIAPISGARYVNYAIFTNSGDVRLMASGTDKMGLWGATPVVQPTTSGGAATFVTNTSLIANDTATFDGYTIGQVVKALRNIGILA